MALPSPVLQANRRGSERGDGAGGRCVGHGLGHARSPRSPAWVSAGRWFSPVKPESVGRRAGQGGAYLPVDRARPMSCGACTAGIAPAFPPWRGPDTWTVTRGPSGRPRAALLPRCPPSTASSTSREAEWDPLRPPPTTRTEHRPASGPGAAGGRGRGFCPCPAARRVRAGVEAGV